MPAAESASAADAETTPRARRERETVRRDAAPRDTDRTVTFVLYWDAQKRGVEGELTRHQLSQTAPRSISVA
ncbi:hypothetical protein GCM10009601_58510 [Streptomyces thermospinosisporus]|uniref:Uncharacterized protein n=1 Tax=Streptomyces thermospinosisporus TaxID=161482 RepID=A0ABN1Z762_9ACTN